MSDKSYLKSSDSLRMIWQWSQVMLRKACPGLLLTFASVFVGLCKFADTTSSLQHPICKPGLEFWSTDHAVCWPCTRCAPNFTLSPCALHKDAICGPLSALELNWSFLSTRRRPEADQHRLGVVTSRVLWRFPTESIKRGHERTHKTASNLVDLVREDDETLNDEKPVFSSRESKVRSAIKLEILKRAHLWKLKFYRN